MHEFPELPRLLVVSPEDGHICRALRVCFMFLTDWDPLFDGCAAVLSLHANLHKYSSNNNP